MTLTDYQFRLAAGICLAAVRGRLLPRPPGRPLRIPGEAIYLLNTVFGLLPTDIGCFFGFAKHHVCAHHIRYIENRRDDPATDRHMAALEERVRRKALLFGLPVSEMLPEAEAADPIWRDALACARGHGPEVLP